MVFWAGLIACRRGLFQKKAVLLRVLDENFRECPELQQHVRHPATTGKARRTGGESPPCKLPFVPGPSELLSIELHTHGQTEE